MQAQANEDGPSAPDLQLDWLSSSSDSDDTDDDSGIEVVSVKYQQQSAQKVSWCEKCVQNGRIFLVFINETGLGVDPVATRNTLL
jgi:hypothetical protein